MSHKLNASNFKNNIVTHHFVTLIAQNLNGFKNVTKGPLFYEQYPLIFLNFTDQSSKTKNHKIFPFKLLSIWFKWLWGKQRSVHAFLYLMDTQTKNSVPFDWLKIIIIMSISKAFYRLVQILQNIEKNYILIITLYFLSEDREMNRNENDCLFFKFFDSFFKKTYKMKY